MDGKYIFKSKSVNFCSLKSKIYLQDFEMFDKIWGVSKLRWRFVELSKIGYLANLFRLKFVTEKLILKFGFL